MQDHISHGHDHHHDDGHSHDHDHGQGDHGNPRPPRDWDAMRRKYAPYLGVLVVAWALYSTFFTVAETEFVLVTQFGRPVGTVTEAGLHVKWPYQSATYFDRRLRVYNPRPSEFLTRDKKNLVVESYVLWQIDDPEAFVQTVGDEVAAEMRLHDITWAGLAAALGNHDLDAIVSPDPEKLQAQQMLDELAEQTGARALEQYGIRVVDVRIKRLNLPEQNKQSVYARMRAERERIARQYRAEGEEQALRYPRRRRPPARGNAFSWPTSKPNRPRARVMPKPPASTARLIREIRSFTSSSERSRLTRRRSTKRQP